MRSRLRRELHNFLEKDQISLESGIVNKLVYKMAEVDVASREENGSLPGFHVESHYYDENERLEFNLANLSMAQLKKMLAFFDLTEDQYFTDQPLTLNEQFVFDKFLPAFKAYYETQKQTKPAEIAYYRVKSMPILESTAINTLQEQIDKAMKAAMVGVTSDTYPAMSPLCDTLLMLRKKVESLSSLPVLYKSIIDASAEISRLSDKYDSPVIQKHLSYIQEGLQLFAKYNRTKSVLANIKFMEEVEKECNEHRISSSACNIVEDMVRLGAEAKLGPNPESSFKVGYDKSRLVFSFVDMKQEDADKLLKMFRDQGDETATAGHGYRHRGSAVPEMALKSMSLASSHSYYHAEEDLREKHSIEVDGQAFYDKIFPMVKMMITMLPVNQPEQYKTYQEASVKCMAKLEAAGKVVAKPNPSVLFQPFGDHSNNEMIEVPVLK